MSSADQTLLILPGDGIGPEVIAATRKVLDWFATRNVARLNIEEHAYSVAAYKQHGVLLTEEAADAFDRADAILFGAVGGPEYDSIDADVRRRGDLLSLRRRGNFFANIRPIRPSPSLIGVSPLKERALRGVDFVIVRELNGGIYFGEPRAILENDGGEPRALNTLTYAHSEIARIAVAAFDLARTRRGRVCSVDKANVLETSVLWRRVVEDVRASDYADVALSHMYVDNCALQITLAPAQFDVVLTDNLFGDILSDCGGAIVGSLGLLPSASLGPVGASGRRRGFYEPVHGSAPDIAGRDIANPIAAILSLAMAFRASLGLADAAEQIETAVEDALAGGARTQDIRESGKPVLSCRQMADAIVNCLNKNA